MKKSLRTIFISALLVYLMVCTAVYSFQEKLIFPAHEKLIDIGSEYANSYTVEHTADDGIKLSSWYIPPKNNNKNKIILYLHGNGGNISHRVGEYSSFLDEDYGLFALDYRGYGKSEGSPSEEGLYKDARSAVKFIEDKGFQTKDIILYGESLGTAIAIQLASEKEFYAVILESPFTSMLNVAKKHYSFLPVSLLLKHKFDSLSKLHKVDENILVMHGDRDSLVPYEYGLEIYNSLKKNKENKNNKQIISMTTFKNKGHNNHSLDETKEAWKEFLDSLLKI